MNTLNIAQNLELKLLTKGLNEGTEVTDGCVCDLLSWVMARGEEGMAWITVQTHLNVVAVACLHDFACVIIPENIEVPQVTIDKAIEEGLLIYSSSLSAFQICCKLYELGIGK